MCEGGHLHVVIRGLVLDFGAQLAFEAVAGLGGLVGLVEGDALTPQLVSLTALRDFATVPAVALLRCAAGTFVSALHDSYSFLGSLLWFWVRKNLDKTTGR